MQEDRMVIFDQRDSSRPVADRIVLIPANEMPDPGRLRALSTVWRLNYDQLRSAVVMGMARRKYRRAAGWPARESTEG